MGRGPGVVTSIMANVLKYNQELVKQLSEVKFIFFMCALMNTRNFSYSAAKNKSSKPRLMYWSKVFEWQISEPKNIATT